MQPHGKFDYFVVGTGIAGTVLGSMLMQKNRVLFFDKDDPSSASNVASGIFNPIVLKRLTKVWKADEMLAALEDFYPWLESKLGDQFYYARDIVRIFPDTAYANDFDFRSESEGFRHLLTTEVSKDEVNPFAPHGYGAVKTGGYVDTRKMTSSFRRYLSENELLVSADVSESSFKFDSDQVSFGQAVAGALICCQGIRALEWDSWKWIPLQPTKGEILELKNPRLRSESIVQQSHFLLPVGDSRYHLGSTYAWHTLDATPTAAAREKLLTGMSDLLGQDVEVVGHRSGIRPASADRRPIVGSHPRKSGLYIFNGLGSRGVLMAPWLAQQFMVHLEEGKPIPVEADVVRFK